MRFSCNHYQIMNNQLVKISKWILGNTLYNKLIFFFVLLPFSISLQFSFFLINQFISNYYNSKKIYLQERWSIFIFTYDLKRKKIKLARINFKLFLKFWKLFSTTLEKQPWFSDISLLLFVRLHCALFFIIFPLLTFGIYHYSGQGNGQRRGGWTWGCGGGSRGRRHGEAHRDAQYLRDTAERWRDAPVAADPTTRGSQALQFSGRGCTGGTGLPVDTSQ